MSRKNKNLRAFLHQNPKPTIEQAWNSAWSGAQKTFHARSMQEMRSQVDRLQESLRSLVEYVEANDPLCPVLGNSKGLLKEIEEKR